MKIELPRNADALDRAAASYAEANAPLVARTLVGLFMQALQDTSTMHNMATVLDQTIAVMMMRTFIDGAKLDEHAHLCTCVAADDCPLHRVRSPS